MADHLEYLAQNVRKVIGKSCQG